MLESFFLCEIKKTSMKRMLKKNGRTTVRSVRECEGNRISLWFSCLHIVNYIPTKGYTGAKLCEASGMSLFRFPPFLIASNPLSWLSWGRENIFIIKLLISMAHRWPSLHGANSKTNDLIVGMAGLETAKRVHMMGLEYSESSLVHIRVTDVLNSSSPDGLHILLCNHPMVISNGLCLQGHSACEDGTCILNHYICDGRADCPDASDEAECSHVCSLHDSFLNSIDCFSSCIKPGCTCNDLYFSCTFGGCVPWSRVCNRVYDCPHGEDEQLCPFQDGNPGARALFVERPEDDLPHKLKESIHKCTNGPNISRLFVNDLVPDCPEQDDEEAYLAFLKDGSRPHFFTDRVLCTEADATTCEKNYRGVCYPRHLHYIHEIITVQNGMTPVTMSNLEVCRNGAHLSNCELYSCPFVF